MVKLVNLKEQIKGFYERQYKIIHPVGKILFTFAALWITSLLFPYGAICNDWIVIALASLIAALLPLPFTFFAVSVMALWNLYSLSLELMVVYLGIFLICWLLFIRLDRKFAFVAVLTPLLFFLKIEFLLPVIVGMGIGMGGILPIAAGSLMYFLGISVKNVMVVSVAADSAETGLGAARLIGIMVSDKKMLVVIGALIAGAFIIALIYQIFHERAWIVADVTGNAVMAVLLLVGNVMLEINLEVWRVVLLAVIGIGIGILMQFFKGIGDITRMEKVSFEDDDYIYYVKAIPKIRLAKKERNVKEIKPETEEEPMEEPEELLDEFPEGIVEEPEEVIEGPDPEPETEETVEETVEEAVEEPTEETAEETAEEAAEEPAEETQEEAAENVDPIAEEIEEVPENTEEVKEEENIDEC